MSNYEWENFKFILAIIVIIIVSLALGMFFGLVRMDTKYNSNNMFCPECGRRYIDVVYCEYCGTELKEIQK